MKTRITHIGSISTWSPNNNHLQIIRDVEIMVEDEKILEIGSHVVGADEEIDANGALITPGFVDSHTHPIFIGNRAGEFSLRVQGKSYEDISASGGGILSSFGEMEWSAAEKPSLECREAGSMARDYPELEKPNMLEFDCYRSTTIN